MSPRTKVRHVEQSLFPHIQPDKPVGPILPSVFTGSNADLMLAVSPFYLTGSVMDCTYGEGRWWDRYRPEGLTYHDVSENPRSTTIRCENQETLNPSPGPLTESLRLEGTQGCD